MLRTQAPSINVEETTDGKWIAITGDTTYLSSVSGWSIKESGSGSDILTDIGICDSSQKINDNVYCDWGVYFISDAELNAGTLGLHISMPGGFKNTQYTITLKAGGYEDKTIDIELTHQSSGGGNVTTGDDYPEDMIVSVNNDGDLVITSSDSDFLDAIVKGYDDYGVEDPIQGYVKDPNKEGYFKFYFGIHNGKGDKDSAICYPLEKVGNTVVFSTEKQQNKDHNEVFRGQVLKGVDYTIKLNVDGYKTKVLDGTYSFPNANDMIPTDNISVQVANREYLVVSVSGNNALATKFLNNIYVAQIGIMGSDNVVDNATLITAQEEVDGFDTIDPNKDRVYRLATPLPNGANVSDYTGLICSTGFGQYCWDGRPFGGVVEMAVKEYAVKLHNVNDEVYDSKNIVGEYVLPAVASASGKEVQGWLINDKDTAKQVIRCVGEKVFITANTEVYAIYKDIPEPQKVEIAAIAAGVTPYSVMSVEINDNAYNTQLENNNFVQAGETGVAVWVEADEKTNNTVEYKQIEKALGLKEDYKKEDLKAVIDINVFTQTGQTENVEKLSETATNAKLSIDLSDNSNLQALAKEGKLGVFSIHEAVPQEIIAGTYNEANKTYTFETNKFSTFGLVSLGDGQTGEVVTINHGGPVYTVTTQDELKAAIAETKLVEGGIIKVVGVNGKLQLTEDIVVGHKYPNNPNSSGMYDLTSDDYKDYLLIDLQCDIESDHTIIIPGCENLETQTGSEADKVFNSNVLIDGHGHTITSSADTTINTAYRASLIVNNLNIKNTNTLNISAAALRMQAGTFVCDSNTYIEGPIGLKIEPADMSDHSNFSTSVNMWGGKVVGTNNAGVVVDGIDTYQMGDIQYTRRAWYHINVKNIETKCADDIAVILKGDSDDCVTNLDGNIKGSVYLANGQLNILGECNIESNNDCIQIVTDQDITTGNKAYLTIAKGATLTSKNGSCIKETSDPSNIQQLLINGGNFNAANGYETILLGTNTDRETNHISIKGGTYSKKFADDYRNTNTTEWSGDQAPYTLVYKASELTEVDSLSELKEKLADGYENIKLTADIEAATYEEIIINQTVTIDLNNHILKGVSLKFNAEQIQGASIDQKSTIKNGKLIAKDYPIIISNSLDKIEACEISAVDSYSGYLLKVDELGSLDILNSKITGVRGIDVFANRDFSRNSTELDVSISEINTVYEAINASGSGYGQEYTIFVSSNSKVKSDNTAVKMDNAKLCVTAGASIIGKTAISTNYAISLDGKAVIKSIDGGVDDAAIVIDGPSVGRTARYEDNNSKLVSSDNGYAVVLKGKIGDFTIKKGNYYGTDGVIDVTGITNNDYSLIVEKGRFSHKIDDAYMVSEDFECIKVDNSDLPYAVARKFAEKFVGDYVIKPYFLAEDDIDASINEGALKDAIPTTSVDENIDLVFRVNNEEENKVSEIQEAIGSENIILDSYDLHIDQVSNSGTTFEKLDSVEALQTITIKLSDEEVANVDNLTVYHEDDEMTILSKDEGETSNDECAYIDGGNVVIKTKEFSSFSLVTTDPSQQAQKHNVFINLNDGQIDITPNVSISPLQVKDGNKITDYITINDISKENSVFKGWYIADNDEDPDNDAEFDLDQVITDDISIYARWADVYTVSINLNGGQFVPNQTVDISNLKVEDGRCIGEYLDYQNIERTDGDYDFNGWFIDDNDGDFDNDAFIDFGQEIHEDLSIYAAWRQYFHVNVELNGGYLGFERLAYVDPIRVEGGRNLFEYSNYDFNQIVKPNYIFIGWYVDDGDEDLSNDEEYIFDEITEDISIYATWELKAIPTEQTCYSINENFIYNNDYMLLESKPVDWDTNYTSYLDEYYCYLDYSDNGAPEFDGTNYYAEYLEIDKDSVIRLFTNTNGANIKYRINSSLEEDYVDYNGQVTLGDCEYGDDVVIDTVVEKEDCISSYKTHYFKIYNETLNWGDVDDSLYDDFWNTPSRIKNEIWVAVGDKVLNDGYNLAYEYTGKAIVPEDVKVFNYKTRLQEKVDYTISYKNNVKVGYASMYITFKGNNAGTYEYAYNITRRNIAIDDLPNVNMAYTGNELTVAAPKVSSGALTLKNNVDYIYEVLDVDDNPCANNKVIDKGTYRVYLSPLAGSNYTFNNYYYYVTVGDFTNDIAKAKLTGFVTKIPYFNSNGEVYEHKQDDIVLTYNGEELNEGEDYILTYINNNEVGTATLIITGIGEYYGSITKTYAISGVPLNKVIIDYTKEYDYTGSNIEPEIEVLTYCENPKVAVPVIKELERGTDYDYFVTNNYNAGKATITFVGMGGFTGTVNKPFTIKPIDFEVTEDIQIMGDESVQYQKGSTIPYYELVLIDANDPSIYWILEEKVDYTVSFKNNTKVGKATMTFTGKGNYKGKLSCDYVISAADFNNVFDNSYAEDVVVSPKAKAYIPKLNIVDWNGKNLVAGTDYEKTIRYFYGQDIMLADGTYREEWTQVEDTDIIPVGTELVAQLTGKGNYHGCMNLYYRVVEGNLAKATVTVPAQYYNNGKPVEINEGQITVKVGNIYLTSDDFEIVSNTNNTDKGNGILTIKGKGNYGGTKVVKYKIDTLPLATTVRFNGNGASTGSMADVTITNNKPLKIANKFKRNGYTLKGFALTPYANEAEYQDGEVIDSRGLSGANVLYAVWQKNTYTLTLNNKYGTAQEIPFAVNDTIQLETPDEIEKKVGGVWYKFDGWCAKADATGNGTGALVSEVKRGTVNNVDVYAKWSAVVGMTQDNTYQQKNGSLQTGVLKLNDVLYCFDDFGKLMVFGDEYTVSSGAYNPDDRTYVYNKLTYLLKNDGTLIQNEIFGHCYYNSKGQQEYGDGKYYFFDGDVKIYGGFKKLTVTNQDTKKKVTNTYFVLTEYYGGAVVRGMYDIYDAKDVKNTYFFGDDYDGAMWVNTFFYQENAIYYFNSKGCKEVGDDKTWADITVSTAGGLRSLRLYGSVKQLSFNNYETGKKETKKFFVLADFENQHSDLSEAEFNQLLNRSEYLAVGGSIIANYRLMVENGKSINTYYFTEDGHMAQNELVIIPLFDEYDMQVDEFLKYYDKNGNEVTGLVTYQGLTLYFDPENDNKAFKGASGNSTVGLKNINGKWYYFQDYVAVNENCIIYIDGHIVDEYGFDEKAVLNKELVINTDEANIYFTGLKVNKNELLLNLSTILHNYFIDSIDITNVNINGQDYTGTASVDNVKCPTYISLDMNEISRMGLSDKIIKTISFKIKVTNEFDTYYPRTVTLHISH